MSRHKNSVLINVETIKRYLPLLIVLILLSVSFFYGWYSDASKAEAGRGWADQETYRYVANSFVSGDFFRPGSQHFAAGYSLLGAITKVVFGDSNFMVVSYVLLIASATLCFEAVRKLFNYKWALVFSFLLFYWDGFAKTLNFSSEIFAVPWNNQVLFFTMAFYFWLFTTRAKKEPSWLLTGVVGAVSGLSFLTREETILFVVPMAGVYLYLTRARWQKWLLCYGLLFAVYLPQLIIKLAVANVAAEGVEKSRFGHVLNSYLQPRNLYRNIWGTIIDSRHFTSQPAPNREALLQAAPWLWLSPIGLAIVIFSKKFAAGVKIFVIATGVVLFFYLSGNNMSAQKLRFHCMRYISSTFIGLNLGVVVVMREVYYKGRYEFLGLKNENKSRKGK